MEAVATLPLLLLTALVAWQLVLTGQTLWLCAGAARSAARAELVGESARGAARGALPRALERGLSVERVRGGALRVEVRVPLLLRAWDSPLRVAAVSSLRGAG